MSVGDALRGHVEKSLADLEQYPTKLATRCATLLSPAQNARGAGDSIRSDTALANMDALVFHNRAHGGIKVVFRRSDGHIGWIDPHRELRLPTHTAEGQRIAAWKLPIY